MKCHPVLIGICVLMAVSACSQQGAPTSVPLDVHISLHAEPEPLAVGDSALIITLEDANGTPVDGAALQVHANMDHEGMMPVEGQSTDSANGEYRVPLIWTMGGGWSVTITAQLPNNGGEASETFDLFVEAMSSQSIIHQQSLSMDSTPEVTSPSGTD
jgi:hypothetical protein